MERIEDFRGDHRWLSNFYWCPVEYEGDIYPSTEHAYQAAKTLDPKERKAIREAKTFKEAKHLGYKVALRKDWENVKLGVMLDLLRQKFSSGQLREQLLSTGDAYLVEGNTWGDTYWGVCNGKGQNHLGMLLMQVREEIKPQ